MTQTDEPTTEQIQAAISAIPIPQNGIVLVKLGNDHFPVFNEEQMERARQVIGPILQRMTSAPILFWNHAIEIETVNLPGSPPTDAPLERQEQIIMMPSRAQRDMNL